MLGVVAALFGLLLAFVIIIAYQNFLEADANVTRAADALSSIVRDSEAFPGSGGDNVRAAVGSYVRAVVNDEWPQAKNGHQSVLASGGLDAVGATLQMVNPKSPAQVAFYDDAVTQLNAAVAARRDRLRSVAGGIPRSIGVLILFSSFVIIGYAVLVGSPSFWFHVLGPAAIAMVVAVSLVVLVDLSYPFSGSLSISAEPYKSGSLAQFFTTPASSSFQVGLSTATGGLNDRGFNDLAYVGLLRADALGVQGDVVIANSPADYIANLTALARNGYGFVIAVGFDQSRAVATVAKRFPTTHFAIVDASSADVGSPPNVEGLLFREQEAGYLAGYAAGLAAKDRGGKTVSTVGGQKQPPVDRYIAGFQAGAKASFPGVTTLNGYSQDFSNPAKCEKVALNQISAGSVVVFQVAGGCGLGALDAAREQGIWGIGVDADQGYVGPYVLTSALKRVDTAVFNAIQTAQAGKFQGGRDVVYGIDVGGVGIGKFSPKTPAGIAAATRKVEAQMKAGKITNIPTIVK
jgi:basic membrane protein A and related proteins